MKFFFFLTVKDECDKFQPSDKLKVKKSQTFLSHDIMHPLKSRESTLSDFLERKPELSFLIRKTERRRRPLKAFLSTLGL